MPPPKNEAIICRLFEEIFAKGNVNITDELFDPDYIEHQYTFASTTKQFFTQWRDDYLGMHVLFEELDTDRIVARWTSCFIDQSTHTHLIPTRPPASVIGVDIYRLTDGKIVEHWGNRDIEPLQ